MGLDLSGMRRVDLTTLPMFRTIHRLNLSRTSICDVSPLIGIEDLGEVDLTDTPIPIAEVDRLKRHKPSCRIIMSVPREEHPNKPQSDGGDGAGSGN